MCSPTWVMSMTPRALQILLCWSGAVKTAISGFYFVEKLAMNEFGLALRKKGINSVENLALFSCHTAQRLASGGGPWRPVVICDVLG
jgi:hypothetical protein